MDAHSFRILARFLAPLLHGARIDKIYGPLPELTVFHCFGRMGKFLFAIQTQKQQPRYFIQRSPLPNPAVPAPSIMRLRKYLVNAHFGQAVAEPSSRTLALPVTRHGETLNWLLCSPSRGILLCKELPENFPIPTAWPDENTLEKLLTPGHLEDPATWLAYPILTPLLRKTLANLDKPEALALMVDLEAGGDTLFFYGPRENQPTCYYAWPLPDSLCKEAGLVPLSPDFALPDLFATASAQQPQAEPTELPQKASATKGSETNFAERPSRDAAFGQIASQWSSSSPTGHPSSDDESLPRDLALASFIDEQNLHKAFTTHTHKDGKQDVKRERKRLRRKERVMEQEALRLQGMVNRQQDARLIQENLWRLDPEAKYENITLTSTLPTGETETRTISLDPSLSVRDNMLEIFKKAEKGKRGLAILATRRQQIPHERRQLDKITVRAPVPPTETSGAQMAEPSFGSHANTSQDIARATGQTDHQAMGTKLASPASPHWHNLVEQPGKYAQKNVAVFRSSDGYTILRGKNAQGNRQILKLGKPHDLWLHVQDGPSAHAIIKRDHAQDEVPESTISEAARLVAEKSWLKENDSAEVMLALVKNVQSIKGAAAGTVKVDKILQTVYIKRVSL